MTEMKKEKKLGRPTIYNEKLAKIICDRIAKGESVRSISRDDKMPDQTTILAWAIDISHPFSKQYDRAREIQAETLTDELHEIADDARNDFMERQTKDGFVALVDHEHIARSKLRIDTRKWAASKLRPKRYGEKVTQEITGKDGGPVQTIAIKPELLALTDEELKELLKSDKI